MGQRLSAQQTEQLRERILALRKARGWTQRELCNKSGLAYGTVASIEAGVHVNPTLGTMLALVRALGLRSLEELLGPLPTNVFREDEPSQGIW